MGSRLRSSLDNLRRGYRLSGILVFATGIFLLGILVGNGTLKVPGFYIANSSQPKNVDVSPLWRVWNKISDRYDGQVDSRAEVYGALKGLVAGLGDPYSEFMTPDETKAFQAQLEGRVEGIGAEVGMRSGRLVIISPIKGSPADQAGLKPADAIVAIDGKPTDGLSVSQAVAKIRGAKGTKVTLGVSRAERVFEITITRDVIQAPSVDGRDERGVGYIRVSRFSENTAADFRAELSRRLAANPAGLIIDLRGDPGGYLNAATAIISEFIPEGEVVVRERSRTNPEKLLRANSGGLLKNGGLRVAVLIDEGSASASEIVAGALRDYDRAKLIGQKSFGKGSVQDFETLADGSSLRLTIAHWFTPDGRGIDKTGLTPDITVTDDSEGQATLDRAVQYVQTGK